jgi:hypothetical protein
MLINGRIEIRTQTVGGGPELLVEFTEKLLVTSFGHPAT